MAAGTWTFFKSAKKKILRGNINFSGTVIKATLHKSGAGLSGAADYDTVASITAAQLSTTRGYSRSGKTLPSAGLVSVATNNTKYSAGNISWSANGGNLGSATSIKYCVLFLSGAAGGSGIPICFVTLTQTGTITVPSGSALIVNSGGASIFTLS